MIQGALLIALAALLWATTGIVAKFLFTGTELEAITLARLVRCKGSAHHFDISSSAQHADEHEDGKKVTRGDHVGRPCSNL